MDGEVGEAGQERLLGEEVAQFVGDGCEPPVPGQVWVGEVHLVEEDLGHEGEQLVDVAYVVIERGQRDPEPLRDRGHRDGAGSLVGGDAERGGDDRLAIDGRGPAAPAVAGGRPRGLHVVIVGEALAGRTGVS